MKARCPESHRKPYHETDWCLLNDSMCLLESGLQCEIYREYLAKSDVLGVEDDDLAGIEVDPDIIK